MSPRKPSASKRSPAAVWRIHSPIFEADAICPLMPVWPWGGHRAWAYDLVRFMKPPVIAELGVHWGTSLFAFAQAVKDGSLSARIIGVDTWAGDDHTGPYGSEVLATVRKIAADRFPGQQFELHQMTFDRALDLVPDGSINLLHIDGFHEYDAVKHDFDSWLPKLAPEGVVLLHDVAENTGYGSARYWNELNATYPGFAFEHSWGLGVVFPKGDRWYKAIQKQNLSDKRALYTYRALHDRVSIELRDTGAMAVSRLAAMESMEGIIKDRDAEITLLKSIVSDRDNEIRLLKSFVSDRDAWLAKQHEEHQSLRVYADTVAAQASELRDRADKLTRDLDAANASAAQLRTEVDHQTTRAQSAETQLAEQRSLVQSLTASLDQARESIRRNTEDLAAAQSRIDALEQTAAEQRAAIEALTTDRDTTASRLGASEERVALLCADLHAMNIRIEAEGQRTSELRLVLTENQAMTDKLRSDLQRLEADIEMLAMRVEQLERVEIEREEQAARRDRRSASRTAPSAQSNQRPPRN